MAATAPTRRAARCGPRRAGRRTGCRSPGSTRRAGRRTRAARSPARRAATPRSCCCRTSGASWRRWCAMPDARVQSAIDHWAPRFVQAGMDSSDFLATVAGVERWEDWLDAFAGLGDAHAARAAEAEALGRHVTAREAWLHAAVAYHFARFVWVLDASRAR